MIYQVKKSWYNTLIRELSGDIFHRKLSGGSYFVKPISKYAHSEVEKYIPVHKIE